MKLLTETRLTQNTPGATVLWAASLHVLEQPRTPKGAHLVKEST